MPGPTLYAEVGDLLVVHFRNADTQAAPGGDHAPAWRPLQPRVRRRLHGPVHAGRRVRGARRGVHVPVGVRARAVGAWPYHDHGPNHTLNTFRGLFGSIVITRAGAAARRRLRADAAPAHAAGDRAGPCVPVHQRPRVRRQHADAEGAGSARRSPSTCSGWTTTSTTSTSTATAGGTPAGRSTTPPRSARRDHHGALHRGQPGRWLYHCHVFSHQDEGMAGWYDVSP